ncbi:MAG: hypothetical protein ACRD2A_13330 [Vicinamibacterales bacterium]
MASEVDFADWPLQTVTWAALTGRDQYGVPTYGTATSVKAYVVPASMETRALVEERNVQTIAYLLDAPNVAPEDKLTLPDGTSPVIVAVNRFFDERGNPYYTKVMFGERVTL